MRNKLDFVKRNIADWTRKMDTAMRTRAAELAAVNADLDAKIIAAKAQLVARQNDYVHEDPYFLRKIWFFSKTRAKYRMTKLEYEYAQSVVTKLEAAKELIANLQRDDTLRQTELIEQNNKINPLWDALNAKVSRNEVWDATDNENYKKIEKSEDYINDMCERILQNTKRIAQCHQMATAYDDTHPERFPGHWLEIATIIVERNDIYGFQGEIDRHDLGTSKKLGTGLEGYGTSYGAILKPGQVVRYTMPGTQILLEQDHHGRVHDKTPINANQQHKILAAIKTAHLLLLDLSLHPEKKIHLKGGREFLPQLYLIIAALKVHAKQAGMELKLKDMVVKVPGWKNWRGSLIESRAAIKQNEGIIAGILTHHHAQNELKDKIQVLKGKTIIVGEHTHAPKKY